MIRIKNTIAPKDIDIGDKYVFQNEEYICQNIIVEYSKVYAKLVHCLHRDLELLIYICEEKDYDFSDWEE